MNRPGSWRHEFSIPLNALQGELNRLLAQYRHLGPFGASRGEGAEAGPAPAWVPAVDVVETPDEIAVTADIPGVDPATVELTVTGRVLTLRGEKVAGDPAPGAQGHALERQFGPFHREVPLPSDVNVEAIQAEAQHGVLRVRLPKSEAVRPRSIPIRPS
jgi:HSP20 family protein